MRARDLGIVIGDLPTGPLNAITDVAGVRVGHTTLIAADVASREEVGRWSLPVVGETWDGYLNDVNGQHVRAEHVLEALQAATGGPVAEGNVGGGTGMKAFGLKAGIGATSSSPSPPATGGCTPRMRSTLRSPWAWRPRGPSPSGWRLRQRGPR